jgi:glutaredoxin
LITIYTTKTCSWCKTVKTFFDRLNHPYQTIELDDKPEERQRLFDITGAMTVPITTNGESYVVGFNIAKLKELVG